MAEEDFSLRFECPTCAAGPEEKCIAHNGASRCESHGERMEVAMEYYCPRPEVENALSPHVSSSESDERSAGTPESPLTKPETPTPVRPQKAIASR